MAQPTGKLKFAYQTITNMEEVIKKLNTRLALAEGVIENLKPYDVDQRNMVNSYFTFNKEGK